MITATLQGEGLGQNTLSLEQKTFVSGKTGFWGQTKLVDEQGNRYQAQIQVVKIQPKVQPKKK